MPVHDPLVPPPVRPRRGIQSVEAGGQLLLALGAAARPMPLGELARAVGMATGKAHPYLVSFAKLGLVTQDPSSGHYWLGPTAMQLGLATLRLLPAVQTARPFVQALAHAGDHSVALSVWADPGPTVVYLYDAVAPLHTNIRTGTLMSLTGSATGQVFAAYLPPQRLADVLAAHPPLSAAEWRDTLHTVRRYGLARAINRPTPGVCSFAAPVFDARRDIALAITLMGSSRNFSRDWDGPQACALQRCAADVSASLAATSSSAP